jgi:hypothetical protein
MRPLTPDEKAAIKLKADRAEARSKEAPSSSDPKAFVAAAMTEGEQNAEIERLAKLPFGGYESERKDAAARLGWRTAALDEEVGKRRPKATDTDIAGGHIELTARQPAADPVDGNALLTSIVEQTSKYVYIPENEKLAAILWLIASHAFDSFFIFPRLQLKSPTMGCGKSTLLDVIDCLTNKPLIPSNAPDQRCSA